MLQRAMTDDAVPVLTDIRARLREQTMAVREAARRRADRYVVLLVEDDPDTVLLLRDRIGAHHRLRVAGTVREALSVLAGGKVERVAIDYTLPDGDGREVLKAAASFGVSACWYTGRDDLVADGIPIFRKPNGTDGLIRWLTGR